MGIDPHRYIRSLAAPRNIEFLGEIPEPRLLELYATCRGLVATAADEDFGLTPLEAMAAGEGGYRETVVQGKTGWLVRSDPEALSGAIRDARPERLDAMRAACESRAREFDVSVFIDRMRVLVERAVRRP